MIAKTSETIRSAGKELDKEDKKALKADLKQLETLVMKYRPEKMNEDDIARVKEKCEKHCQTANDSGITLG